MINKITYYNKDAPDGKRKEIEYSNGDDATDATAGMYWVSLAIICFVGALAVMT